MRTRTKRSHGQTLIEALESRVMLDATPISSVAVGRLLVDDYRGGSLNETMQYSLVVGAADMTNLQASLPWGGDFDAAAADFLPADWDGSTVTPLISVNVTFSAYSTPEVRYIQVTWDLSLEDWNAMDAPDASTTLDVYYGATDPWERTLDFSSSALPSDGHAPSITFPEVDQADVRRDPTITIDDWQDADGTGRIQYLVRVSGGQNVSSLDDSDSTTSFAPTTPTSLLEGVTTYDLAVTFVQPGSVDLDGVATTSVSSQTTVIENFTTETSNVTTISKLSVTRLHFHDLTAGGDTAGNSYEIYAAGTNLIDMIVTTPWSTTVDLGSDFLPTDWAGETYSTSNGDVQLDAGTVEGGTDYYFDVTWTVADTDFFSTLDSAGADVVIRSSDGQDPANDGVWRGELSFPSSASQPGALPNITSPETGGLDVDPNVVFTWDAWAGAGATGHVGFDLDSGLPDSTPLVGNLAGSATNMTPTVSLLGGQSYIFAVNFFNAGTAPVNGVSVQMQSETKTTMDFSVLVPIVSGVETRRGIVQKADQSGSTYEYALGIWGDGLSTFSGTTPWGTAFTSASFLWPEWAGEPVDDTTSVGNLRTNFQAFSNEAGQQQFIFIWTGLNAAQWTSLSSTAGAALLVKSPNGDDWSGHVSFASSSLPGQAPKITSPKAFDGAVDPTLNVTWNAWTGAPAAGTIEASLGQAITQEGVASDDLAATETAWQPSSGDLDADDVYEVQVRFNNPASTVTSGVPTTVESYQQAAVDFGTFGQDNVHLIGTVAKAEPKGWSYTEDAGEGDKVTPSLTGKGYAEFLFDSGGLLKYVLVVGDGTSKLSMGVVTPSGNDGDGLADVGGIISAGSTTLGALDLSKVALGPTGIRMRGGVKTLTLLDVSDNTPLYIGGTAADKMTFTARRVGNDVDLRIAGTLDKLNVAKWISGEISALGLNTLTVAGPLGPGVDPDAGNDFGADLNIGIGGIKQITVTGGDLTGAIYSQGSIDKITVTAMSWWNPDGPEGGTRGGNILSPEIAAGVVKGKPSLGPVTLTGGSFGTDDSPVDLTGISGDIGNITIKALTYKSGMAEVLDKNGEPVYLNNGDPKMTPVFWTRGGGIAAVIDTSGKVGNLTTVGGDLAGTIHAKNGIGAISVQAVTRNAKKLTLIGGVNYVASEENMTPANLLADLSAETATNAFAIKSIAVTGGNISSHVEVTGKIGPVSTTAVAIVNSTLDSAETVGGNFDSELFKASGIGNISVTAGSFTAVLEADAIGNISVLASEFSASVTVRNSLGNVSAKAVVANAVLKLKKDPDNPGSWVEADGNRPGFFVGGDMNLSLHLGGGDGSPVNTHATWGTITGTGTNVYVVGTIPWDSSTPAMTTTLNKKITSKVLKYVPSANADYDTGKVVNDPAETIGGNVGSFDDLTQAQP